MIIFKELNIRTPKREILLDITNDINNLVRESKIKEGVCRIFVPHTTAGITINENTDPSVLTDITGFLNKLIPKDGGFGYNFKHMEGNSDAHIKSSLTGPNLEILIHNERLMLGTWQACFLAEFDGPRNRKIFVQVQGN
jgi:secondary thiamine-phosphate synthase enzyme